MINPLHSPSSANATLAPNITPTAPQFPGIDPEDRPMSPVHAPTAYSSHNGSSRRESHAGGMAPSHSSHLISALDANSAHEDDYRAQNMHSPYGQSLSKTGGNDGEIGSFSSHGEPREDERSRTWSHRGSVDGHQHEIDRDTGHDQFEQTKNMQKGNNLDREADDNHNQQA